MQTTYTTNGTEVSYERHGDGRSLILLHGGMAPREYWNPVVPHLEAYTIVIPQRPGFGTRLDEPATGADEILTRETEYVRALVDDVDGVPVLFGHSYGGLTAIEAATDAMVEAVVAYEPAVLPREFRMRVDLADRMEELIADGKRREAVKRYVDLVLHSGEIDDLDAWLTDWPVWPDCVDLAEEVARMNRAVEQYRLPDRFDIDVPTLVLTGTHGPDFLREGAREVHEALSHSRLVEFDAIGHSGPVEAPELISAEVDIFVNSRC
ncbi:alpha/beta fold hydrolase [Halosolutus gelatinilyticus]|uniref:alpha/beta fold hydrolase n=1 Tax=Halosolutus gelatinilyticus TaxID=2931975 RepID=UPI001FF4E2D7|nr:alpha/beta hydrolase [Halosolutus gelatinilyticus]